MKAGGFPTARTLLFAAVTAVYAVAWSPASRQTMDRADPMSPDIRAIEHALGDRRGAEALRLATAAAQRFPRDPFPKYLEADALGLLGRWSDQAAAWEDYARRTGVPELACPGIATAYDRAGDGRRAHEWRRRCDLLAGTSPAPATPARPETALAESRP